MECSRDIALSLLNSWQECSAMLNVFFAPTERWPFKAAAIGKVQEVTPETLSMSLVVAGEILLDISVATFDYSDAREEESAELREEIAKDIVCTLQIKIPGYLLALGEMRDQPESMVKGIKAGVIFSRQTGTH